jgi:hypothetical protein
VDNLVFCHLVCVQVHNLVFYDIYKFRQSKQEPGESIDTYHTKLRKLAENCVLANVDDEIAFVMFIATSKLSNLSFHFFQRVDVDPSACTLNGGNCGNDAIAIVFCNVFLLISFGHRRMGF